MKIAVTSMGENLESPVDKRFGRSRYFILYDTETEEWQAHSNRQNMNAAQGAGIQAAKKVATLGADASVTGHCGPKAFKILAAAGIDVYLQASGTVKEAMAAFSSNMLKKAGTADVDDHFGSV